MSDRNPEYHFQKDQTEKKTIITIRVKTDVDLSRIGLSNRKKFTVIY